MRKADSAAVASCGSYEGCSSRVGLGSCGCDTEQLQVSAALGIPYAYLSNDMIKANYCNARLALLEFRRRTEAYQHAVMVWQLCRRVWARWMDTAVLAGALAIPGYEANCRQYRGCSWLPPKWDWVDPLKCIS